MKRFFEIFKAGTYPQGNYTPEQVAKIADNYDPNYLEAPVTLDHGFGGPAYGWVDELKADGKRLLASFKEVTSHLKEITAKKEYKRHSVEIYNDLDGKGPYLKALSMLGALSPAVKGMEPIAFTAFGEKFPESDSATIEFDGPAEPEKGVPEPPKEEPETFTEAEFQQKIGAFEDRLQKLSDELSSQKQTTNDFKSENKRIKFEQRQSDFASFIGDQVEAGKLLPKLKDKAIALFAHLDGMEAKDKQGKTPLALFSEIIAGQPVLDFEETAKKKTKSETVSTPETTAKKAQKYQQEQADAGHPVSFTDAVNYIENQE